MKIRIDSDNLCFTHIGGQTEPISLKRRDSIPIALTFLVDGAAAALAAGTAITLALKLADEYGLTEFLASCTSWSLSGTTYTGTLDLNTTEIADAFGDDEPASVAAILEASWQPGGAGGWRSTQKAAQVLVQNDAIRGDEGVPTAGTPAYPLPGQIVVAADIGETVAPLVDGKVPAENLPESDAAVTSVAGRTGDVVLVSADITDASEGGNGSADYGKAVKYGGNGQLGAAAVVLRKDLGGGSFSQVEFRGPEAACDVVLFVSADSDGKCAAHTDRTDGVPDNLIPAAGQAATILAALGGAAASHTHAATDVANVPRVLKLDQDQSVTNSTTKVALPLAATGWNGQSTLSFPVAANAYGSFKYVLELEDATTADSNYAFSFAVPSGCAGAAGLHLIRQGSTTATHFGRLLSETISFKATASGNGHVLVVEGTYRNGANAGSVELRWSQGAALAATVTCKKGSSLTYT